MFCLFSPQQMRPHRSQLPKNPFSLQSFQSPPSLSIRTKIHTGFSGDGWKIRFSTITRPNPPQSAAFSVEHFYETKTANQNTKHISIFHSILPTLSNATCVISLFKIHLSFHVDLMYNAGKPAQEVRIDSSPRDLTFSD